MYFLMLMVLISTSLSAMDKQFVPSLINELLDTHFVSCVTLQEKSRLRCTCKGNMDLIITENFLYKDNSYALDHLFNKFPYDLRSKILAHYGLTNSKQMFTFLWDKEKKIRDDDVREFNRLANISPKYCMKLYAEKYSTVQKIQKIRFKQLECALNWQDKKKLSVLKIILQGSDFNIFNIKYRKKKLIKGYDCYSLRSLFSRICSHSDADLLLVTLGGKIEPRAFKYVFCYSEKSFIEALKEKNAFIKDVPDKRGKTFHYYQRSYDLQLVRALSSRSYGN